MKWGKGFSSELLILVTIIIIAILISGGFFPIAKEVQTSPQSIANQTILPLADFVRKNELQIGSFSIVSALNSPTPQITPQPIISQPHTTLTLTQPKLGSDPNHTIAVQIDTNSDNVWGVELHIGFDSSVIQTVTINPGTFFPTSVILKNSVDYQNQNALFAIVGEPFNQQGSMKGSGTLAAIIISFQPNTTQKTTTMYIQPTTIVTADGVSESALKSQQSISIPVVP